MERQKILIVEDDADISGLLVKIMEGAGYQVRQVFSGTEASLFSVSVGSDPTPLLLSSPEASDPTAHSPVIPVPYKTI